MYWAVLGGTGRPALSTRCPCRCARHAPQVGRPAPRRRSAGTRGYARGVSTADVVVVVAAGIGSLGAIVSLGAAFVLVGQVRRLERGIEVLRHEALPLVEEARAAAGHAAKEIARVDAVLADTEAVTAAVDRASRMARRAFANPVVRLLAWRAGAVGGLRSLSGPQDAASSRSSGPGAGRDAGRDAGRAGDRGRAGDGGRAAGQLAQPSERPEAVPARRARRGALVGPRR